MKAGDKACGMILLCVLLDSLIKSEFLNKKNRSRNFLFQQIALSDPHESPLRVFILFYFFVAYQIRNLFERTQHTSNPRGERQLCWACGLCGFSM
jgi:hypothetical protein